MKHYGLTTRSVVTQRNLVHHNEGKQKDASDGKTVKHCGGVAVYRIQCSIGAHTKASLQLSTSVHSHAVLHFNVGVGH